MDRFYHGVVGGGHCIVFTGVDTCSGCGLAFSDRKASAKPTIPGLHATVMGL